MTLELLTIGSSVGKAIFPAVAKELIAKFKSALNPTDLEKALKAGINAAIPAPASVGNLLEIRLSLLHLPW